MSDLVAGEFVDTPDVLERKQLCLDPMRLCKRVEKGRRGPRLQLIRIGAGPDPTLVRQLRQRIRRLPGFHAFVEIDVGRRDFAGLENRESPLRIAPLDVLRKTVMFLDPQRDLGQLLDLLIGQCRRGTEFFRHRDVRASLAIRLSDGHDQLLVDALVLDREGALVDDVLIRIDASRDDCFTQPQLAFRTISSGFDVMGFAVNRTPETSDGNIS